jgi:lipopolysaccharide transport system ATP-binding protein
MSSEAAAAEVAVDVRGLGKCYHVYGNPQDRLKQALFGRWRTYHREFWALRGVDLQVRRGEAVGIIGVNGSGKSTLLQVIAGTLAATEGTVATCGRVSALLELGSGFNPEFSGRENALLNGAILGIPRREMGERLAGIAAFADIGAFLEQPVKTYSSGMHARLAFAVAVSVDPDVLIVDEILAVGDMGFQQKCLGRIRALRERGLTLLLVSHAPDTIRSVCDRALFLAGGTTQFLGAAEPGVDAYLRHVREQANTDALAARTDLPPADATGERYGTGHARIVGAELFGDDGRPCRAYRFGDEIRLEVVVEARSPVTGLSVSFLVRDMTGVDLMGTTCFDERVEVPSLSAGEHLRVRFGFRNQLRVGNFGVSLAVHQVRERDYSDNVLFDQIDGAVAFAVIPDPARPVHYKFHQPVTVECERISDGV